MNNSSEDNGIDITHYIRIMRTRDGQCRGIIQVLGNEDGVPPATIYIDKPTASLVMAEARNLVEVTR